MLDWTVDRSSHDDILRHLRSLDAAFTPPLSARVDLPAYAERLATKAARIEVWDGDLLIGLVAVYCNAPDRVAAFVTSVGVLEGYRGRGLARGLMQHAICHARDLGFARIGLEVDPRAEAALRLYRTLGFQKAEETPEQDNRLRLSLDLRASSV